jgi:hypothetical protein
MSSVARSASNPKDIGDLSSGVKRPEHEADHVPQYNAKFTNAWSFIFTPLCTALCLSTRTILP